MAKIPYIPSSAPFTAEQRAWLNGYLVGLFSEVEDDGVTRGANVTAVAAKPQPASTPLLVMYGSQTGTAEQLAKKLAKEAPQHGFVPRVMELNAFAAVDLSKEQHLVIVTSTWGDGDPPDNAVAFWSHLNSDKAPKLDHLRFALLALGDRNYANFCGAGKKFDERLEQLGAQRILPREDCDVDYESPARAWMERLWPQLIECASSTVQSSSFERADSAYDTALHEPGSGKPLTPSLSPSDGDRVSSRAGQGCLAVMCDAAIVEASHEPVRAAGILPAGETWEPSAGRRQHGVQERPSPKANSFVSSTSAYGRANPFPARLLTNRHLNAPGSAKDTRHFEISLEGSALDYQVGDALGVLPANCPALVEELLQRLGYDGEEAVPDRNGVETSLRRALLDHYQVTQPARSFVEVLAERTGDCNLNDLLDPIRKADLDKFLHGREVIDFLLQFPKVRFAPKEFVGLLRKLQPRLYSISSSPKAHPSEVHLTVAAVRYESYGRPRKGVCSTFLADRAHEPVPVPVFIQPSHGFRLPTNSDQPIIMIGPGTGIAPFRAFLEERRAIGATGKNWLFFGDQRQSCDFLYRDELEALQYDAILTQLDMAFSRDQDEKIYVQHRMREHTQEFWAWLEAGAHVYVCGDAKRMAKDVDAALHELIQSAGSKTAEQAAEYVTKMKTDKRYQRDVY